MVATVWEVKSMGDFQWRVKDDGGNDNLQWAVQDSNL